MAPAMTLKRMYHWVPSIISTMDPMPSPPPRRIRPSIRTGKSAVAGIEARTWVMGWTNPGQPGIEADGNAHGDGPERAEDQRWR